MDDVFGVGEESIEEGEEKGEVGKVTQRPNFETVDTAIETYVSIRDELRVFQKEMKAKEDDFKERLDAISMWLRDMADKIGVDSFKTAHGTAYRNVKESFRVEDWDLYVGWMITTGNFQCVEKRPAKNAVKEVVRESGEIPPGLNRLEEVEFNVLRPKKAVETKEMNQ